jgi:Cd2+/Zn2+-exporting ATPase
MTDRALTPRSIRLDIPLLLPGVKDDQDACVARLVSLLEGRDGFERIHIVHDDDEATAHAVGEHSPTAPQTPAALCLHYDPDRITLSQIQDLAKRAGAAITDRYKHAVISFRDIGSEDEGSRLEGVIRAIRGVTAVVVNFPAQVARVEFDSAEVALPHIVARLVEAGAKPEVPKAKRAVSKDVVKEEETGRDKSWYARNEELAWSLIAGALTLAGWMLSRTTSAAAAPIVAYVLAYVFGARDNVGHLLKDLRRGRFHFNIDFLMVVAAIGAAILGQWAEGALLLFLFSLGHALEHYALGRARNAIKALSELAPQTAVVRRGSTDISVAIEDVGVGEMVVAKPGERIAVDGDVQDGRSAVNQAPITGESVPVEKAAGDKVFAGTVNGEGVLLVKVAAAVGDRTLDRVVKLVSEAETQKAPTQQFTDRFQRIFVPVVLVADVLLIVVLPLLGIWSFSVAFYRAMALLVAASPCALALGTPATVLAGIAQAARNGILIKGGAHLEALGDIDIVALDKTGTITKGEPAVTDVKPESGVDANDLIATAASVERQSQHPLARAIVRHADEQRLTGPHATDVQSVMGRGIRANVDGAVVEIGRVSMFDDRTIPESVQRSVDELEAAGRTTMIVHRVSGDSKWLGVIGVADEPRADIRNTLGELRSLGVRSIVMLTGDNEKVASSVARTVGIDDVRAGLMPEDKVTAIRDLTKRGRVAMVGDGVNDAPAMAHALVGIAMGGAGTAAALETADVALMGDRIERLPFAIGLSRAARRAIRQNLAVSLIVIGVLAVSTVAGIARIGPAVIAHEDSTLVVIANALRLLFYRGSLRKSAA